MKFIVTLILLIGLSLIGKAQCPTAAFNANPTEGCAIPHTVFFTDQSTLPDTWLWDFGDGNTSTAQNPIHSYTTTGLFIVSLTVQDTISGCTDNITTTINVSTLSAEFNSSSTFGCGPITANFTDNSTINGSSIASWAWDFGDGNTSSQQNPTHNYTEPGTYTVSLTVTDNNGCTNVETKSNYIQVIGPDVDFEADALQGCNTLLVNFTDNTIFSSPPTSWAWSFGDGNTSNSQNPTHTYSTSGDFDVSLTVSDLDGCSRTFTIPEYISILSSSTGTDTRVECNSFTWIDGDTYTSSNNTATHTLTNAVGCDSIVTLDLTINSDNTGTDVVSACNSYTWIDGDTYTSSNNTATHTLTNVAGCDSIVTLDLTINEVSDISTSVSGVTISGNNSFATYQWLDCDDNYAVINDETNQSFTATANGNYAVELTENGCVDTSACVAITTVSIVENDLGSELVVFPNPTDGNFTVDLGANYNSVKVSITDLIGKRVQSKEFNNSEVLNLTIDEPAGVYLLRIESDKRSAIIRLVKE
ncbi:MAG: PKD domain-containing protein [Brumimicrobium sp.]